MTTVDKCLARSLKPMQPHQKTFIKAFMRSTRRGTIAIHSPGSGKTLMAMGAAKCYLAEYPASHVIIVAPASLIGAHEKQLNEYEKKLPGGKVPQASKFSFYTYAGFSTAIRAGTARLCEGALVICDEAQALKGSETQVFADMHACTGVSSKVILLSATPITNTDADLMNLMAIASGSPVVDDRTMTTILENDKLMRAYFGCQLSWYASDPKKMAAFFPKKDTRIVPIVMDPSTLRTYTTLENDKMSRTIEGIFSLSGDTSADTNLQSFFNGLRRISSSSGQKIEFIIDYIKHVNEKRTSAALGVTRASLSSHTNKFVIFTHFKDHGSEKIIAALKKAGIAFGIIDGSVPKTTRTKVEAEYVAGRITVILISAAGSTGLNLLETGYIFLMEPSWNMSEVQQVEARGVRFLSHDKLPKSLRNVLIIKLMLIKPDEARRFDRYMSTLAYDEQPSIDIKMFIDSARKQIAIDARLAMLEAKVPSLESCATSRVALRDFAEMRVYRRTSSNIATVPAGVRSTGQYYAPGKKMAMTDLGRTSFNDGLLKEIVAGSGVMRATSDTAVLIAGSARLLTGAIMAANSHIYPHLLDEATGPLVRRYRIGIINWAFDFASASRTRVSAPKKASILKQMNSQCDLLLLVIQESERSAVKDALVGRKFSEASYTCEFDRAVHGADAGVIVLTC